MEKDTLFTRRKKLFQVLGIVEGCSIIIMAISLLCLPLASFNPTKLDVTKVSFNFFKLLEPNPLISVGFFFLCISGIPSLINKAFIQKNIWREKLNIMILLSAASIILFIIGAVVLNISIMEYVEPNTSSVVILQNEIGAYLFWIGLVSIAIEAYEVVCLKLLHTGKYTEEQLFGRLKEKSILMKDINLEDKLNELSRLRQSGVITEDEYLQKKKELLDLYK